MKLVKVKDGIINITKMAEYSGVTEEEYLKSIGLSDQDVKKEWNQVLDKIIIEYDLEYYKGISVQPITYPFGQFYDNEHINVFGAIWVRGEHNELILKSVAKFTDEGWESL